MGYKIKLTCNNCNYEKEFILGQLHSQKIDQIILLLDSQNQEQINNIIQKDNLLTFTFYRKLSYCENCKCFGVTNIINIFTRDDQIINLQDNCKECNQKVICFDLESNNNINIKCIKCDHDLLICKTAYWD